MPQVILVVLNIRNKDVKVKVRNYLEKYDSQDIWILSPRQIIQRGMSGFPTTTCIVIGEEYIIPACYNDIPQIIQANEHSWINEIEKAVKRHNIEKIQ